MKRRAGRISFVAATSLLSALLTALVCLRQPILYDAVIHFQIADSRAAAKPDLVTEKKLILSDAILTQVLKDTNLIPPPKTKFRSFDLGPAYPSAAVSGESAAIEDFKNNISVKTYPENAVISIGVQNADAARAKKIVETLFRKYLDWRQADKVAAFNAGIVAADRNLSDKREAFVKAQTDFLNYAQNQPPSTSEGDPGLDAKIAALKLRYGPRHPVLREALRQKDMAKRSVPDPERPDRLKNLRARMDEDFRALDTAIRQAVLLEQTKTTVKNGVEILALGDVEVRPVPDYMFYKMAIAALAGLFLSLLYLKIRSRFGSVVMTSADLQAYSGWPVLGEIPGLLQKGDQEIVLPAGPTMESLKDVRQELRLRGSDARPVKLVTVTATNEHEGRSEFVTGLGRIAARRGEKVIILDADLRSPGLERRLKLNSSRNLVDYLSGQSRLEDVIVRTDPSGAHVIFGTSIPNTALDLISSEKMKTLLQSLREVYDLVLVRAPISTRGPDARVLAAIGDHTLYLVEAHATLQKDISNAVQPFTEIGLPASFVLCED